MTVWQVSAVCLPLLLCYVEAFYVPGVGPQDFKVDESVDIKAVKLTSVKAQLPYDYYSLPFCKPEKIEYKSENLGEVLRGDRIVSTVYSVKMASTQTCRSLCATINLSEAETQLMRKRVEQEYNVHLLADNLPCATKYIVENLPHYEHGYKLGFVKDEKVYLNNHLKLILMYNVESGANSNQDKDKLETYRIVAFEVIPQSIKFKVTNTSTDGKCDSSDKTLEPLELPATGGVSVLFTYEVQFLSSPVRWASRWDQYLAMADLNIHWFSIINSVIVVFFLAGIVTIIIVRTLRRDIAKYNKLDEDEDEALEESGWKLVHGDVFRPPASPRLLSALTGAGIQISSVMFIIIAVAMMGMLSPASRGALMTAALFLFVFMGAVAGYYSGRLYKTMKGLEWKKAALMTAVLYPSVMIGTCFILNFFILAKGSSGAVPVATMFALLCMWIGISMPLVFVGYYFGFRKAPYEHPVRVNQICRQIPEQVWYLNPVVAMMMAGILPFGAMFIELFFIFSAIWENQFYYLFGFLFVVFLIIIVSCSQISIVMTYFQLCSENYHWWWRSFIVSGGSAVYIFLYSIFYFFTKLEITEFIPTLLYFGYSSLMVFTLWLLTGTVGFYAAYYFVSKIYGAIKID